jgi:hypothetical protein
MPRRFKRGVGPSTRGRHKKRHSGETKTWEQEHLIPKKPPWMDDETYQSLKAIREERA